MNVDHEDPRANSRESRDAQDSAGLLVGCFQFQGHGQIFGQPQRQDRQRLADNERVSPSPEMPGIPLLRPAACGVDHRRLGRQRWIGLAKQLQQIDIKVESARSHQIDEDD
jgi:hypothetical protein